jgi:plastocyanin
MKRRNLLGSVGVGSAAILAGAAGVRAGTRAHIDEHEGGHDHGPVGGPLANATVSFGAWPATGTTPLDRTALPTAPAAPNIHQLIPQTATIKAGGSVNFVVAGFHQIVVYKPGTKPGDIDTSTLIPIPGAPPAVGLIDDPENRLFRGVSPLTVGQDRVEVVHFGSRGLYLVICAVSVHFADGMFGWVRVLPG